MLVKPPWGWTCPHRAPRKTSLRALILRLDTKTRWPVARAQPRARVCATCCPLCPPAESPETRPRDQTHCEGEATRRLTHLGPSRAHPADRTPFSSFHGLLASIVLGRRERAMTVVCSVGQVRAERREPLLCVLVIQRLKLAVYL